MSKHLLIVESPAKAKTLHKYLGKDYEVMASYGHVRDLVPKTARSIPPTTSPCTTKSSSATPATSTKSPKRRKPPKTSTSQRTPIAKAKPSPGTCAKSCANAARSITKNVYRVAFHEITQNAIQQAVAHPRQLEMDLVNAQQARRALDYLVGFNLSPLLWRKVRPGPLRRPRTIARVAHDRRTRARNRSL